MFLKIDFFFDMISAVHSVKNTFVGENYTDLPNFGWNSYVIS